MVANSVSHLPILDLENRNDPYTPHFEVNWGCMGPPSEKSKLQIIVSHILVTSGCIGGVMSCTLDNMTVQMDSGAIESF